jgi:hypothetical protein
MISKPSAQAVAATRANSTTVTWHATFGWEPGPYATDMPSTKDSWPGE